MRLFTADIYVQTYKHKIELKKSALLKKSDIYSQSIEIKFRLAHYNKRMGNVTYDRQTIDAARSRIRDGMNQPGATGTSTGAAKPTAIRNTFAKLQS